MNTNDYLRLYQNLTANGYTGTMEELMEQMQADQDPRAVDQNIGMVTAYAYAVSKGYTGTEDEFAELMANLGTTAQEIETAVETFVNITVPAAVQQVTTTGETQVRNVNAAGAEQLRGIAAEGTQQRQNVTTAGEQQVTAINNKGTEQIDAVQAKGDQVIASIPADYTALTKEVSDVKSALNDVYSVGRKTINAEGGHVYVQYEIISDHEYVVMNNTDKLCAVRTCNTLSADTVQTITDSLMAGRTVEFIASANANYLRCYFSSNARGTIKIIDKASLVFALQNAIGEIDASIADLPTMMDTLDYLYSRKIIAPVEGYVTLVTGITVNDRFRVTNSTNVALSIASRLNGNTVEVFTNNLAIGSSVELTVSQPADTLNAYCASSSATGSIEVVNLDCAVELMQDEIDKAVYSAGANTESIDNILSPIRNNSSLWEAGGFYYSGAKNADADKCRSIDFIDESITSVLLRDTSYSMYVFGWDSTGACVGYWYDTRWNQDTSLSLRSQTSFAFDMFRSAYPGYKFKLVLHKTGISIANIDDAISFTHRAPELGEYRQRPMLTFIDDDGYAQSAAIWEDIANTCDVPVTMALITANVGVADYAVNWDDVARLKNIGFEFVSHTHEHIFLGDASLTENEVIADFKNTIAALASHGCESKFLVYPYTTITSENEALVRKYFSLGISLQNQLNVPYISKTMVHRYDINSGTGEKTIDGETVTVHLFRDFENMKSIIDDAVLHNGWIVFMSHLRNTYRGDQYYYDANVKQLIVDTVAYARSRNVEITTVSNAYAVYRNVIKRTLLNL